MPKRTDSLSNDRHIPTGDDTDAGAEAARGIHGKNAGGDRTRPGSEPLKDRKSEHESKYGGRGGTPKSS